MNIFNISIVSVPIALPPTFSLTRGPYCLNMSSRAKWYSVLSLRPSRYCREEPTRGRHGGPGTAEREGQEMEEREEKEETEAKEEEEKEEKEEEEKREDTRRDMMSGRK